jgi:hypothetical protein
VPGDCGSWVVDSTEDVLFGALKGSSRPLGIAYITPASQIIEDLKYMYPNSLFHLPQRNEIQLFSREIPLGPAIKSYSLATKG